MFAREILDLDGPKEEIIKRFGAKLGTTDYWQAIGRFSEGWKKSIMVLLSGGCICGLVFGLFSAEFSAATRYYSAMQNSKGFDYSINVKGGTGDGMELNTSFPRGIGVSQISLNKLEETPGLKVESALVSEMGKAFLLVKGSETNSFLKELVKSNYYGYDVQDSQSQERMKQAPQKIGYRSDETVVDYPIAKIDRSTLKNLSRFVTVGNIDYDKFSAGKEVAVQGGHFQIGDHVIITCPVFSEPISETNPNPQAKIYNFNAEVGAILSVDQSNLGNRQFFPYKNCVVFSAEAIIAADPTAMYDNVYLTKVFNSTVAAQNAKNTVHSIAAQSQNTAITDVAEYATLWKDTVNQQKWPVYLVVACLMVIFLFAYAITISLKLKTNLRTYSLLRAIGMSNRQITRNLYQDTMKSSLWGILSGTVLAFFFCTLLALRYSYIPALPIYFKILLPATVVGCACILIVTVVACVRPVRWIIRQSIVESLSNIEY